MGFHPLGGKNVGYRKKGWCSLWGVWSIHLSWMNKTRYINGGGKRCCLMFSKLKAVGESTTAGVQTYGMRTTAWASGLSLCSRAREKSEQAPAALNEDTNEEEVKGEDKARIRHQMLTG